MPDTLLGRTLPVLAGRNRKARIGLENRRPQGHAGSNPAPSVALTGLASVPRRLFWTNSGPIGSRIALRAAKPRGLVPTETRSTNVLSEVRTTLTVPASRLDTYARVPSAEVATLVGKAPTGTVAIVVSEAVEITERVRINVP